MKKLKIIDLFSGGGGFSYAAEKLVGGYKTIQFVENEPYCQKVLKKHWPTIPIHDDIKTYKPEPYSAHVVCGGFPCQDLSVAGKGQGITKETRSGLFYELMRVVCVVRPKYVIMENVAAILNNGLGIVLGELSKARFDAEWGTFRASDYVRTCHHRDRWFCIGINRDFTDPDSDGYKGRWSEICNKDVAGQNSPIIRPTNTGNFKRQSNDESNQGQSRVNENISGSSNTGEAISSKSGGVCELSKKANNYQGTSSQDKNQKNKDRTLVSEGQSGVQLSQYRGLGSNKATSEGHSIRQRNDNNKKQGMDNQGGQKSDITNTNEKGLQRATTKGVQRKGLWPQPTRFCNPNWKEYGAEPSICRNYDGAAPELFANRAARIKLLGNGLVPQCAAIPLQRVLDLENESQT